MTKWSRFLQWQENWKKRSAFFVTRFSECGVSGSWEEKEHIWFSTSQDIKDRIPRGSEFERLESIEVESVTKFLELNHDRISPHSLRGIVLYDTYLRELPRSDAQSDHLQATRSFSWWPLSSRAWQIPRSHGQTEDGAHSRE
jgi:hypothetical protein